MDTIYNLLRRALSLRGKTQTGSITPDEVGGLHYDTLEYLARMEQSADGLGIRKVYPSKVAMLSDAETPVGTNGRPLRFGQLVTIYDPADPLADGTGTVYAFQKPGWLPVGAVTPADELMHRLQGTSPQSDASTDPFRWLGTFRPEEGEPEGAYVDRANAAIDSAISAASGNDGQKWCGRLRGSIWGNQFEVMQFAISYADGKYVQLASGCLEATADGTALTFSKAAYAEFWRYVRNGVPGPWQRFAPTSQPDVSATAASGKYVYSSGANNLACVMAAGSTKLLQNGGNLIFRAHVWNPKSTSGQYFSSTVPRATASSDGCFSREVFSRLGDGATIYEGTATATTVPVSYPNWAAGGSRIFTLRAATSARAGVMTAADKTKLDALPNAANLSGSLDDLSHRIGEIQAQPDVSATDQDHVFVYSSGANDLACVMAAGMTGLLQNGGNLIFRAHIWNPQGTSGKYFSSKVPRATAASDGCMSSEVMSRLGTGASIYESTAGADSVPVSYPDWAAGGARTFTLGAATSARAGVMTAADKAKLDALPAAADLASTLEALRLRVTELADSPLPYAGTQDRAMVSPESYRVMTEEEAAMLTDGTADRYLSVVWVHFTAGIPADMQCDTFILTDDGGRDYKKWPRLGCIPSSDEYHAHGSGYIPAAGRLYLNTVTRQVQRLVLQADNTCVFRVQAENMI